jgi:hypothetical protein
MEGMTSIDVSAALVDGTKFDGPSGLRTYLLARPNQIVTAVSEKLLTYALGRGVEYYDAPALRRAVREASRDNYTFAGLITAIVKSTPFQMRSIQGPAPTSVAAQRQ